jgi:alkanesulfonate monooxygenase SsuD/methylene tetrahydromethanopterin reductase-like flavin-dependent oxidoreductase (luciferase family)
MGLPSAPIKFGALLWTQRTDWKGLQDAAIAVDRSGFDSIWVSDHLLSPIGAPNASVFEAWTTISAIGALTRNATIGHIVGSNTFRNPGLVAKMAVTLDHLTGGRAVLGLGAGWLETEHTMHGLPFESSPGARIDRLSAAVSVIRGLLDGEIVDQESRWYSFVGAQHAPQPVQQHLPILIGGEGPTKTLRLVAERADMWNARGSWDRLAALDVTLADHCAAVGRDPGSIERLTNRWIAIRDEVDDARRAIEATNRYQDVTDHDPQIVVAGPPDVAAAALQPVVDAGFRHIVLSLRAPWDHETITRLSEVRELLNERLAQPASHPSE